MAKLTGGQALAQSLKRYGVDTIFGLPGVQLDWFFDGLYDLEQSGDLTIYHTRHEQATAYMADGYARTTGKPGVCVVVPGPGLLNAMAGLSTAYSCCSPVLCISGQIRSDLIGKGRGELHEIPYQLEMMKSVTKWAGRAMQPGEVPGLVRDAFTHMLTGNMRPVEIEVPPDVLMGEFEAEFPDLPGIEPMSPDPDLIEQAAKALGQAERPLIFVGGGVHRSAAWEELKQLAELLEAPVVMSVNGKGALSYRHHLGQGQLSAPYLTPEADAILAVGTRFVGPANADWGPGDGQTVIQMDNNPEEIGRNHTPDIGILADARVGLRELVERTASHNRSRTSRADELNAMKAKQEDLLFEIQPQASYAAVIREELPDDGFLIAESTQVGYYSNLGYPVYEPNTYLQSGYQGTLGYGFATALGVQVGNPDKKVISINGDGGFYYNIQELSTMARFNINLIAIVFNDGAYGNVRRTQKQDFNGRTIATDLYNPEIAKTAESFGVQGIKAEGPEGLRTAIQDAMKSNAPAVIEVPVGEMPRMWDILRKGQRL